MVWVGVGWVVVVSKRTGACTMGMQPAGKHSEYHIFPFCVPRHTLRAKSNSKCALSTPHSPAIALCTPFYSSPLFFFVEHCFVGLKLHAVPPLGRTPLFP